MREITAYLQAYASESVEEGLMAPRRENPGSKALRLREKMGPSAQGKGLVPVDKSIVGS
jgi:hypothetical protein